LAFPTQAVLARNPLRNNFRSLWTQHTVRNGNFSSVRYYEIDPFPRTPVLLRHGNVSTANTFLFNASISPDRRVDGTIGAFGGSFVLQYNRSGALSNIRPGIRLGSSLNGGALTFATLASGVSSFRNSSCAGAGSTCRWGNYSAVSPDPRPAGTGRGVVWLSNQFSGIPNPPTTSGNWRTRIAAIRP